MKKYIKTLVVVALLFGAQACSDNVADFAPQINQEALDLDDKKSDSEDEDKKDDGSDPR